MAKSLESFAQSVGLPLQQAEGLREVCRDQVTNGNGNDGAKFGGNLELACQVAQAVLDHEEVDTSPLSTAAVEGNWSQACIQEPYCILTPRDSGSVAKVMRIISFFGLSFAIRAGGHSPNPGWSSVGAGGVLVDLQKMGQISLSGDKTVASVGPGARWGAVQAMVGEAGVSVVGARVPSVGVGGLILGGGYFHLSPEYGLAADNVKNFEVVLSDGSIINANASEHTDLFWALKGGGSNFGVVTRYDLYTIPVHEVWYQINVYPTDQADAVLDAVAEWQSNSGSSDPKGSLSFIIGLQAITLGLIYGEPRASPPSTFAPFYALEPLPVSIPATNGTFAALNAIVESLVPSIPERHDYRGVSSLVDAQLYKDVYAFWKDKALAVHNETGASQTFVIQHVPASLIAAGHARGGNPLGMSEVTQQWWTTLADWKDPSHDDLVRSVSIETTAYWERLSQERGLGVPFLYMNDASRDQEPLASYGAANLKRLKDISLKYDTEQVFQKQQNGGFKL